MLPALLLQASLLVQPLYLEERPPALRSARAIVLRAADDAEAALDLARRLRARLEAGEPFELIAEQHSSLDGVTRGGVLGSFAPGMLPPELDRFLFQAAVGELSAPIATPGALQLVQRVETHAAVRQILVAGTGEDARERAQALLAELRAGADFRELARGRSDDPVSAARGGDFAIYERGPRDVLLKAAAFAAEVGQVVGPVRTSLGFHLLQRVPVEALSPELAESYWGRFSAILIAHTGARGAVEVRRTPSEAFELAEELRRRAASGEAFSELAAACSDDPGGRSRGGDLGWIYRRAPGAPRHVDQAFLLQPGELSAPIATPAGVALFLRRE